MKEGKTLDVSRPTVAGLFSGRDDEPEGEGGKADLVKIEDVLPSSHLNLPR